ncbi:MAG: nucleoside hydrolase [Oscillospiraceae bacterium]|nr:nucleoside hydrolase [Oscillospiraceae bacterium]
MQKKTPIIIDCDPGIDDIAALLLARQIPHFDVKAITTVAGNVPLAFTTQNALQLLSFMDWDVPLARGAEGPLSRPLETAEDVHGKGGMCGLTLPAANRRPVDLPAWDLIYQIAKREGGKLEIVAVGPLTNIAVALAKYPDLTKLINRITIMGGAFLAGNTTPAAEFNIYVDPEAAKRIFTSGIPFYLCPLDVTHCGYITEEELREIGGFGSKESEFFRDILLKGMAMSIYSGGKGVPLHDPLALLFAADPSCFTFTGCFVGVETQGPVTRGKTVTDVYSDKKLDKNGFYVQTVNRDTFIGHIKNLMSRYTDERKS